MVQVPRVFLDVRLPPDKPCGFLFLHQLLVGRESAGPLDLHQPEDSMSDLAPNPTVGDGRECCEGWK